MRSVVPICTFWQPQCGQVGVPPQRYSANHFSAIVSSGNISVSFLQDSPCLNDLPGPVRFFIVMSIYLFEYILAQWVAQSSINIAIILEILAFFSLFSTSLRSTPALIKTVLGICF